jgi:SAM-dependent methyltransferase
MAQQDRFYDYTSFSNERVDEIFKAWDNLGGYHGLLIKKMADLIMDDTSVLDVGCGRCHLIDALQFTNHKHIEYHGIDKDDRILAMAKEKHPEANIVKQDLYNLDAGKLYDIVVACGLYSGEPKKRDGIERLLQRTRHYLIITYFAEERGRVPDALKWDGWTNEFILHNIDKRLEIMRVWKW